MNGNSIGILTEAAKLAKILAIQAEIEAMKIANLERADKGFPPAYHEESFLGAAEDLEELSKENEK